MKGCFFQSTAVAGRKPGPVFATQPQSQTVPDGTDANPYCHCDLDWIETVKPLRPDFPVYGSRIEAGEYGRYPLQLGEFDLPL